jgi:hypothetical protein
MLHQELYPSLVWHRLGGPEGFSRLLSAGTGHITSDSSRITGPW